VSGGHQLNVGKTFKGMNRKKSKKKNTQRNKEYKKKKIKKKKKRAQKGSRNKPIGKTGKGPRGQQTHSTHIKGTTNLPHARNCLQIEREGDSGVDQNHKRREGALRQAHGLSRIHYIG